MLDQMTRIRILPRCLVDTMSNCHSHLNEVNLTKLKRRTNALTYILAFRLLLLVTTITLHAIHWMPNLFKGSIKATRGNE